MRCDRLLIGSCAIALERRSLTRCFKVDMCRTVVLRLLSREEVTAWGITHRQKPEGS